MKDVLGMFHSVHDIKYLTDNRTKIKIRFVWLPVSDCDDIIVNGLEYGINNGYDKLDEIITSRVNEEE